MSGIGRGRGKGKGTVRSPGNMQAPDTAAMDRLNQEKANSRSSKPESISQKSDSSSSTSADLPLSPTPTPAPDEKPDPAITTIGEGKPPPLAKDIKDAIQSGVKVGQPPISNSMSVTLPGKLDPEAVSFVPQQDSSSLTTTLASLSPVYSKHSLNPPSPSSSHLNPESKEFVPNSTPLAPTLNGVSCENGLLGEEEEEEEGGYIEAKDLVRGFERAVPTEMGDDSEPVLRAGAEMLLGVYNYPGSFDESGKKFKEAVKDLDFSVNTLTNLAEMLVFWGLNVVDLRYSSCRVCHLISQVESMESFRRILINRLFDWHGKVNRDKFTKEEERYTFANFGWFIAEMYSKISDPYGAPVKILGVNVFHYVEKLLDMRMDYYIREACNILKLTGNLLVQEKEYEAKILKTSNTMTELAMDQSLSKTCVSLVLQVSELIGSRWSCAASSFIPPPVDTKQFAETVSTLNSNAAPFIPAEFIPSETFYDPLQPPVTSAEDWDEFVGEDQVVEPEYTDQRNDVGNSYEVDYDDYDGLDPEIELEMEAFIEEIEEHLMLQDFDPELQPADDALPDSGR